MDNYKLTFMHAYLQNHARYTSFRTRHGTNAEGRLHYISPIVDNGSEDALKTYDQLVSEYL